MMEAVSGSSLIPNDRSISEELALIEEAIEACCITIAQLERGGSKESPVELYRDLLERQLRRREELRAELGD